MHLCDTGSTGTIINCRCFPYGVQPAKGPHKRATTMNETFNTSEGVTIHSIKFPEFGNKRIGDIHADIFHSPGFKYDIILGRTELRAIRIQFDFQKDTISWFEQNVPTKATSALLALPETTLQEQEEFKGAELLAQDILDRRYDKVTPQEEVDSINYLTLSVKI